MKTLKELEGLLYNLKPELTIQASDVRMLIQNHEWSLLWNVLVFAEIRGEDYDVIIPLQRFIRHPELDPAKTLRVPLNPEISDIRPGKKVWQNIIIPYLSLRDQIHLSRVSRYFFSISLALYELRDEFPSYFKAQLKNCSVIDPQPQLNVLRVLAYPDFVKHLRILFGGLVKTFSPSEWVRIESTKMLSQWILIERQKDDALTIEPFSPLTMTIKLDGLSTLLFFLSCFEHKTSQHLDGILKNICQYGATSILQFFLWAFPNDILKFDDYLPVACENRMIHIVKLLAPRVHAITLTMCLVTIENDPMAADIVECLKNHGANVPKNTKYFSRTSACYSDLMKEVIMVDVATNLSIFIKRWPLDGLATLFHLICTRWYRADNFPLDIISFILSRSRKIQSHQGREKSLSMFIREISGSSQLKLFLAFYIPKWRVKILPSSRAKIITAVCNAGHVENFRVLLEQIVDINTCFSSSKHVLTSPLSRAAFYYSRSQRFFNFLIESKAVFTPIAVCHAIEGGQLAGLEALMRLPDAVISNDSLEYHPLFVAAQFGRLDCFDFLMSQGITPNAFTIDQLWDFLIQGPIAGLFRLLNPRTNASWLGPLCQMRAKLLAKMTRVEIGNKYGFPEADPYEFPRFINEKTDVYLKIISMILPMVREKIFDDNQILFIAVSTRNVRLALLVLAYSPAVNAIDENGNSCLFIATQQANRELVMLLLEYGADIVIADNRKSPFIPALKKPDVLAALINSRQYAMLNFPDFPTKNQCLSCFPFFTENSGNPINPLLAGALFERYQLHPDMVTLQQIHQKIVQICLTTGWGERGFGRVIINKTSYQVPGIIAEIYHLIVDFYKLPYSEAKFKLSTVYQLIQNLISRFNGFRLNFNSPITIEICRQIASLIADQDIHCAKILGKHKILE